MRPCIDFLITQKCNYRCEYCSQSKKFSKNNNENASDETIDAFLNFIKTIDKNFEITISGGEPLCHPRFFEVVKKIKEQNLKLTIISNFSFPIEKYKEIIDITGGNLRELFVSLHPTQVKDFEEFKLKAKEINSYKNIETIFSVGSVLSNENVSILKDISLFLKEINVNFCLQHMRVKNSYITYNKEAADFLAQNASPEPGITVKTFGKLCHAGNKFLLIYQNGEAYRCYSSRFNKAHFLGNIKDKNFKIYDKPLPCVNFKCTCPKPIKYGMLTSKSKYAQAYAKIALNSLFLPYLMCKNFDILLSKFEQGRFLKK